MPVSDGPASVKDKYDYIIYIFNTKSKYSLNILVIITDKKERTPNPVSGKKVYVLSVFSYVIDRFLPGILLPFFSPQYLTAVDQQDDCQNNDRYDDHILQHIREDCRSIQTAAEQGSHIVLKREEQGYQRCRGHEDDREI